MRNSMGGETFLTWEEKRKGAKRVLTVNEVLAYSQSGGNEAEAIGELRGRLEKPWRSEKNWGRHIGILAGLKILGENTTPQIIELLDRKDKYGDYPCSIYVFNHFFDALLDKDEASPSYQKEARVFLENILLDVDRRTRLIDAYSKRWYNSSFELEGPAEEVNIETLLSLFQSLEYLWRNIKLDAKLVYVDLLLLEGSEESLRKIIQLTKNKIPITLLEVRVEALFLLYRDFPQSYHVEDLEYFRRKINETPQSSSWRIEWLKMLSYLIEMMRILESETISGPEVYEMGEVGEDIVSMIERNQIVAQNYGEYRFRKRGRRAFPVDRDKEIWDPTLRGLIDFFATIDGFHKKFILPTGVIKTMKLYKSEVPRDYYDGILRSQVARKRIAAVRGIPTGADNALELLKLFSMDTDRIVRSVVIGKLEDMQRDLLIKIRHSRKKYTTEEDLQDKLHTVKDLLFEMSENPDIAHFEKKRILVLLGRASYDF